MIDRFDWFPARRLAIGASLLGMVLLGSAPADAQLRIVSYNTAMDVRPEMETVFRAIGEQDRNGIAKPIDVLLVQEQLTWDTTTVGLVGLLNDMYGAGTYGLAPLDGDTMGAGRPGLIYNTNTVELIDAIAFGEINTSAQARQTLRYQLRPVGYDSSADFYAYNSHYKAGDGSIDQARRLVEAEAIRTDADALGSGVNIIYAGDFNMQSSNQDAFQHLASPGPGQAFDPIDRLGSWHMNPSFADVHTQSPCVTGGCPPGFTGGGMDDRFDLQMVTGAFLDGGGLDYIAGSYHAFGNNGTTFNGNINDPGNTYEFTGVTSYTQSQVLDALWASSDHLPVVADFQLPAVMQAIAGAVPETLTIGQSFDLSVLVSNAANVVAPNGADVLSYSLIATGDVSGSYVNQTDLALSGGNTHFVTFDTSSPGLKTGTITLTSTSQQVASGLIEIPVSFEVVGNGGPPPEPQVIAQWTFETSGPTISGTGTTFGPLAPEEGSGAARGDHESNATTWSSPVGNGSPHSFSSNNWSVGDYYEFQVSTAGMTDIRLELDHTSSNTGPKQWGIFYSTTGVGEFVDTGIAYDILPNSNPSWSSNPDNYLPDHFYEFDLSHITALDDQASLFLRLVSLSDVSANDGTVGTAGASRVDNVTIWGTLMAGLPGDLNGDGVVDAADYVFWRKTGGSTDQYEAWRANFGATAGSGSTLTAGAVPEPSAALLVVLGACLAGMGVRCRVSVPSP